MSHARRFVRWLATCAVAAMFLAPPAAAAQTEYRVLAANKTSTMQKELMEAAEEGFEVRGLTVGSTTFGGNELVTILQRKKSGQQPN